MTFWGVYLKPNEPHTLHYDHIAVPKKLRITQATLGDATRNSPMRSVVKCSVGNNPAIAICSLSIRELTCCQLDLEFEECSNVIFLVVGPRGVYLAGYLISPAPIPHHLGHEGQTKVETLEIGGCSDLHLHHHELHSKKTGSVKESIQTQSTDIHHCDKNMKSGKHLLKCYKDKNKQSKILTLDQKVGKDGNEDSSIGSHEKYINKCSSDKDQEKSVSVKLEEKRDAIGKKKRRHRKRKSRTPEAKTTEYLSDQCDKKFGFDSRITGEICLLDAHERSHDKSKEREKKHKRSRGNVEDNSCGKVKPKEQREK